MAGGGGGGVVRTVVAAGKWLSMGMAVSRQHAAQALQLSGWTDVEGLVDSMWAETPDGSMWLT